MNAREEQLHEILLAYVEAVEAGQAPDRNQVLQAHPHLAADLREFFAGHDQFDRLTTALRGAARASALEFSPLSSSAGELGDFRLLREVGRGGMGVVYEAQQISLHRRVALKVLPFAAALDSRQLQRFQIEAQAAAQLHHTNIVPVFAVGSERGVHYYAMQFIEGRSLAALIEELRHEAGLNRSEEEVTYLPDRTAGATLVRGEMSTERAKQPRKFFRTAAGLGKQAAEALEHAHQMGIVHRDIKPANLLLDARGQLWVTDFGLAQIQRDTGLTATGEVLGTLRYASPEQARARPGVVDQRSDIYSLGATLYELLTLQPLFNGADRGELLRQITFEDPIAPRSHDAAIPVELETILLKALAKHPPERYVSAQEMADDLQRFLDDKPIQARRPSLADRAAKWSRRHRSMVVSALVLLLMGILGLAVSTILVTRAYEGERVKASEARVAQQRAEENFRRAKRAIDLLTQISEDELAILPPPMQGARRKVLDAVLMFHQEFMAEHHDDPAVQPELQASHARVTRLLAELSALQGHLQWMLVIDPEVQTDLQISDAQKDQLRQAGWNVVSELGVESNALRGLSMKERQTKLAEKAIEHEKAVTKILRGEQMHRLQQIALQVKQQGPQGFRESEIVTALKLTARQERDIRKLQEDAYMPMWDGPNKGQASKELRRGLLEKILEILTPEQKAQWRELAGEPFTGRIFLTGPPDVGAPPPLPKK